MGPLMREFVVSRTRPWAEQLQRQLGVALGAGLFLAFLGPFGTFDAELFERAGYWAVLCALWFVCSGVVELGLEQTGVARRLTGLQQGALIVLVTAAPMVAVVFPATTALMGEPMSPAELPNLYFEVALVGGILSVTSALVAAQLDRGREERAVRSPETQSARPPVRAARAAAAAAGELRARLRQAAGGPILCLAMEDHYVRVHGADGSALHLGRMSDAVEALAGADGLRVHRSWWVATAAVLSVEWDGRRLGLRLTNGLAVPVSVPYRAAVLRRFGRP